MTDTKANGNGHYDHAKMEADNILAGIKDDTPARLLKFRDGGYFVGSDPVALGTKFFAIVTDWQKVWIKFIDKKMVDHKSYRPARREIPPERDELDDVHLIGSKGTDGRSNDPWTYQYMLPLENVESGEVLIFTTPSWGGRKAVQELSAEYSKRVQGGLVGCPIIELAAQDMTTQHGTTPRPVLKVVDWDDDTERSAPENLVKAVPVKRAAKADPDDMDDEIPF
jgi:hypothetical protein